MARPGLLTRAADAPAEGGRMGRRGRRRARWPALTLVYAVLTASSLAAVVPFVYVVAAAFKDSAALFSYPPELVAWPPYLGNFTALVTEHPFGRWLLNTVVVVLTITVAKLLIDSLAGYAFAKLDFPGKEPLFVALIATLMVPFAAIMMPLLQMMQGAGLVDTYWALILPPLANPIGIFLMRQFIEGLPSDLDNAARMDGCSELAIFRHVVLPLTKPALTVLAVLHLLNQWNSFLWPLVVTRSQDMQVLTVGIASLKGLLRADWGLIAAGALLSMVPLVMLFVLFQRYFVAASLFGAVKE